ncbi:hypothetical protein Bbelb_018160 [Branchiostoma belcheri]|nr:hypothetical protein Bbelb_018160 [Branchiostoma belcheri]
MLLAITLSGKLLPPQLVYQGKTTACHPKFNFPEEWDIHHSESHWSNASTMGRYANKVLIPYVTAQREVLGVSEDQPALAIFDRLAIAAAPLAGSLLRLGGNTEEGQYTDDGWMAEDPLYNDSAHPPPSAFSTMKRVKTSLRNRLKAVTLNNLLMISIEGPDAEEFDFDSACDKWASMCKRSVSINFRE